MCKHALEVERLSRHMLGYNLVTDQTGVNGLPVESVLICVREDILQEFYLAFIQDRETDGLSLLLGSKGGVGVEGTKVHKFSVDPYLGLNIK